MQKSIFKFLIFFLIAVQNVLAFSDDAPDTPIITEINFSGLKRTRESFMHSEFDKYLNQNATEETLKNVRTDLKIEGLFSESDVKFREISEGKAALDITVKEKITFMPLPFAMYTSSTGFMGGFVVMDTNAFGIKNMFMIGGMFSASQITGMLSYSRPQKGMFPSLSTFWSGGKRSHEIKNLNDDMIIEYDTLGFGGSINANEKIGKYNSVKLGVFVNYEDDDSESLFTGGFSTGWGIQKVEFNEFFSSNMEFSVNAKFGFTNSENDDLKYPKAFSYHGLIQKPLIPRLRICFSAAGIYQIDQTISAYAKRGDAGISILPGKFATERIFGETLGLEFAVLKMSFGVASVYANYESVVAQDFDDEYKFNQGLNMGVRAYLAKIAFPALAVGGSYNITENRWQFAASFGMSF